MVKLKAPGGYKLMDIFTGSLYSEVVCDERKASRYVIAEGTGDIDSQPIGGTPLTDRVADLEDAVIELAELIAEVV